MDAKSVKSTVTGKSRNSAGRRSRHERSRDHEKLIDNSVLDGTKRKVPKHKRHETNIELLKLDDSIEQGSKAVQRTHYRRKTVQLDHAKTTKTLPMRANSKGSLYQEPSLDQLRRPVIETSSIAVNMQSFETKECYTTIQPSIERPMFSLQIPEITAKSPQFRGNNKNSADRN
jgi:hypothetical protein